MGTFENSILDPERHAAILRNKDMILRVANLNEKYLHQSMKNGVSTQSEIDWVKNFNIHRKNNVAGLAMVGVENASEKQMEMCGALLRYFIDGRVMTLTNVLGHLEDGNMPEPSALFIPNFFVKMPGGSPLPGFKLGWLYDLLLDRHIANKPTCLYIESMAGMTDAYGSAMADLIKGQYLIAED
jgi:hypothetical protein